MASARSVTVTCALTLWFASATNATTGLSRADALSAEDRAFLMLSIARNVARWRRIVTAVRKSSTWAAPKPIYSTLANSLGQNETSRLFTENFLLLLWTFSGAQKIRGGMAYFSAAECETLRNIRDANLLQGSASGLRPQRMAWTQCFLGSGDKYAVHNSWAQH